MDASVVRKLLQLNHEFYQTFAVQFSDTRARLQPGVLRIMENIPPEAQILDLGCGNGELARTLARGGFRGQYLGLDFSEGLLAEARNKLQSCGPGVIEGRYQFVRTELSQPGWVSCLPEFHPSVILAFAVLHHIPGRETRGKILQTVRSLLPSRGKFIHSNWQFLNSERLRRRLHPWTEIGLSGAEVEPGDYLLDWRRGGLGLRYVHHFDEPELRALAAETGFHIIETFLSDGEHGNLGLYQVWE